MPAHFSLFSKKRVVDRTVEYLCLFSPHRLCMVLLPPGTFSSGGWLLENVSLERLFRRKKRAWTRWELENPLILIHDKKISDMNPLVRILELAVKVCAIKAPGFGENRRANLDDLAILTGGEVITEERGLNLDKVQMNMLGTAKKLRAAIEKSTAMFDKEKAQEMDWIVKVHHTTNCELCKIHRKCMVYELCKIHTMDWIVKVHHTMDWIDKKNAQEMYGV
ncbi:hypothetical protein LOK49_LG07G00292 [Camellia lanceoleosa]|uniref:Uncharacterized protein n=1 Tax=Camellia lanceoleosa TaxID=1840588 RepID=A0ACC0H271_9ERIC|nr:hypothetical protein LOK49_LG07G00292 [Camellia lanceoleosa]